MLRLLCGFPLETCGNDMWPGGFPLKICRQDINYEYVILERAQ